MISLRGETPQEGTSCKQIRILVSGKRVKEMATEDLQAELARLRAENAALKGRAAKGMTLKVSEKGALSVYGLGRFPVTLYKEQWERLSAMAYLWAKSPREDPFVSSGAQGLKLSEALR
jgi:hypothetical protein